MKTGYLAAGAEFVRDKTQVVNSREQSVESENTIPTILARCRPMREIIPRMRICRPLIWMISRLSLSTHCPGLEWRIC